MSEERKQAAREYQRAWRRANPDRKRQQNSDWNKANRNEYQRDYRAKKKAATHERREEADTK